MGQWVAGPWPWKIDVGGKVEFAQKKLCWVVGGAEDRSCGWICDPLDVFTN